MTTLPMLIENKPWFLRLAGGVEAVVPPSLHEMTSYVLVEQEDWFESEIAFVRRFLKPGMKAVDVGAAYGVYTLAMAKAVGPTGRVWAFEPSSATAGYLDRSLARNRFSHVTLTRSALSDVAGTGRLLVEASPELNRLDAVSGGAAEEVPVDTLDRFAVGAGWGALDLIKIDAEGQERAIVAGAAQLLSSTSPLLLVEVRQGAQIDWGLIDDLKGKGFEIYRHVPSLNVLAPFAKETAGRHLLNVFACKADRAGVLAEAGLLVRARAAVPPADPFAWAEPLRPFPFFRPQLALVARLNRPDADEAVLKYRNALAAYAATRDPVTGPTVAYTALVQSLVALVDLAGNAQTFPRLASLARVAVDLGVRDVATGALQRLVEMLTTGEEFALTEPFLPPSPRLDRVDPGEHVGEWAAVAVAEAFDCAAAYSSYFKPNKMSLPLLEHFKQSRFFGPAMERRRQLERFRAGQQAGLEPTKPVAAAGPEHLNPEIWKVS